MVFAIQYKGKYDIDSKLHRVRSCFDKNVVFVLWCMHTDYVQLCGGILPWQEVLVTWY